MADEQTVEKDPNDPNQRLTRVEAMAVVMKNRMRRLNEQELGDEPAGPLTEPADDPDPDLSAGTQVSQQANDPLVLSDDDLSKYMVRTKVRGEERLVPLAELRATAQKTDAGDAYLRDAKEQARLILEDARAKAAATPAAPVAAAPEPSPKPETSSGEVEDLVGSAIDELFKGNEAEAKRLLKQAVSQRPSHQTAPAAPNTDQIAAAVEQKVVVRSALRQFAKDYPTIYADPIARKVADDFLAEATEGKPLEGFPEERIGSILKETGERVLSWTRGLVGVPANGTPATTRTDRAQRKEGIDELPAASTRATTSVPIPKTTSDVISQMKASRGQLRDPTPT